MRRSLSWWRPVARVLALLLLVSAPVWGQPIGGEQRATRDELAQQLSAAERELAAGARGKTRDRLQQAVAAIRTRLEEGDFQVGDRFVVTLNFDAIRTDTASVRDGLLVALFELPDLSLKGVLRSELNDKLSSHVARYLKNATIRANVLTRVGIFGAVSRPGHYLASPDRPISELVMLAGGPTPEAKLNELEIQRSGKTILKSKDSKQALKDGKTLEQLDVQSGDEVRIATKRKINWTQVIQVFFIISTAFFAFIQFLQWYYSRDE